MDKADKRIELADPWWDWLIHPVTGFMTESRGQARQKALRLMQQAGVDHRQFIDNLEDDEDESLLLLLPLGVHVGVVPVLLSGVMPLLLDVGTTLLLIPPISNPVPNLRIMSR